MALPDDDGATPRALSWSGAALPPALPQAPGSARRGLWHASRAMDADEVQFEIYRRMTPAQRWAAAERLYWAARALKAAYLRGLHPEWTEAEVQQAVKEAFMYVRG